MSQQKSRPVDKKTRKYINSIEREIASHGSVIIKAFKKKDANVLKKAYLSLMRLNYKIREALKTGELCDSDAIQEKLAISREKIAGLQAISQLNVTGAIPTNLAESLNTQPKSYSTVVPEDINFKVLEYANLDSLIALSRTNTRLWDILNSGYAAPIWKELAIIYFSDQPGQQGAIDSMQTFKEAFVKNYIWRYVLPDAEINQFYHYKIKRKNLLWRKAVEGELVSSLESVAFKADFKEKYTDPLEFYPRSDPEEYDDFHITDPEAKGGIPLRTLGVYPDPKQENPFVWHDFIDDFFCGGKKIELDKTIPKGIVYDVQRLYERTGNRKYKEELDYIFNLAIKQDEINIQAIITQFSGGLLDNNNELQGTLQERALFFYVVYLAMRCYQTQIIDQLMDRGFGVNETITYGVKSCWRIIDPGQFSFFYRKNMNHMNMLDIANETRSYRMIDYLITKGVDINVSAEPDFTSLTLEMAKLFTKTYGKYFSVGRNTGMLRFLLDRHADPNKAVDERGIAPLHFVANCKVEELDIAQSCQIGQLLLDHHADVNIRTRLGLTPLHITQHYEVAKMLIENNAEVDAEDQKGHTPLYQMIRGAIIRTERQEDPQATIDIARLLCQAGADPNRVAEDGRTLIAITADAAQHVTDKKAKLKMTELLHVLNATKLSFKKTSEKLSSTLTELKMIPVALPQVSSANGRAAINSIHSTTTSASQEQKTKTASFEQDAKGRGWMEIFSRTDKKPGERAKGDDNNKKEQDLAPSTNR